MQRLNVQILLFVVVLSCVFRISTCNPGDDDYDDAESEELDECEFHTDFKTLRKTKKLVLCDSVQNPSSKSRVQLQIYVNDTQQSIDMRVFNLPSISSPNNRSLVSLTTDFIEDFKYPTSLLTIDDFQLLRSTSLQSLLLSLIQVDLKPLARQLKSALFVVKGGHPQDLSCNGNLYPNQDVKILNITSTFRHPVTCSKDPQTDRFFTLQEKTFVPSSLGLDPKNPFRLVNLHQDDEKRVSRTTWYMCNNPKSCVNGQQDKKTLSKIVASALTFLQKGRSAAKKQKTG